MRPAALILNNAQDIRVIRHGRALPEGRGQITVLPPPAAYPGGPTQRRTAGPVGIDIATRNSPIDSGQEHATSLEPPGITVYDGAAHGDNDNDERDYPLKGVTTKNATGPVLVYRTTLPVTGPGSRHCAPATA